MFIVLHVYASFTTGLTFPAVDIIIIARMQQETSTHL